MAEPPAPTQRRWRSPCPHCGAPVEFASAASPIAVCSYCRSTLAREGAALRRIGQSAELFDDHSPLQIGAAGRWQGLPFTVLGRVQWVTDDGRWNEWHIAFTAGPPQAGGRDGPHAAPIRGGADAFGKHAWLSEDNGRYVIAFEAPAPRDLPPREKFYPGGTGPIDGRRWQVAAVVQARVGAAEGELPHAPAGADAAHLIVELRNEQGEVASVEYADAGAGAGAGAGAAADAGGTAAPPRWSVGRSVALADLALTGLRELAEKTLSARGAPCPQCGAALEVQLATTRSVTCTQCAAVVDVSQGVGGDLAFYAQQGPSRGGPLLPLGVVGRLALGGETQAWQVVGYVERQEVSEDPDESGALWSEYLLYARAVGFAFLVDAEDGWSWAVPATGAPQLRGDTARWQGQDYARRYAYTSTIAHVQGEFYWPVERGQRTQHIDHAAGPRRLNREQSGQEVVWSVGEALPAQAIAQAFRLTPERLAALRADAAPLSAAGLGSVGQGMGALLSRHVLLIVVVLVLLVVLLSQCDGGTRCDDERAVYGEQSAEYRQCLQRGGSTWRGSGGSYGGYGSGGGGHK